MIFKFLPQAVVEYSSNTFDSWEQGTAAGEQSAFVQIGSDLTFQFP